jgi:hypothetical protein
MKGCPARKEGWSPERYARFEKAWKDAVEIELTGERYGITASAIASIAKRWGLLMKVVRRKPRRRKFIAPALVLMLASFGAWAAPPPGSDPNSELSSWFRSLQNTKGEFCCCVADCRRPYAWRQQVGGYQVQVAKDAPWLDVPAENILSRVNLLGDAVACIVGGQVRCFIAPNET